MNAEPGSSLRAFYELSRAYFFGDDELCSHRATPRLHNATVDRLVIPRPDVSLGRCSAEGAVSDESARGSTGAEPELTGSTSTGGRGAFK